MPGTRAGSSVREGDRRDQSQAMRGPGRAQVHDDNHDLAMDFLLQHLYYHNFADAKSVDVDSFYRR